ncbi:hypothetical protein BGC07_13560 [Piscirickettsia litoralis]|uniref:Thioredoxin domain-containing protein n=2 Tax=Piscirickettsia litoralis TaxID=1891921 RepID=A0ABX3A4E0_9GAMM|nr:hypothetical protein BGC07_13560 [Piscirickettsia litoralis]
MSAFSLPLIFLFTFFYLLLSNSLIHAAPLSPDQAFQLTVKQKDNNLIQAHWKIASDYHLYREKIHIKLETNNNNNAQIQLQKINLPTGIAKHNDILGDYQLYENQLTLNIPVQDSNKRPFTLKISYQGCKGEQYCYPPITKYFPFNADTNTSSHSRKIPAQHLIHNVQTQALPTNHAISFSSPSLSSIQHLFASHNIGLILISFLGFGLLLSLTPCVLPMLPILAGIIMGQKGITTRRAFSLSLSYVIGVAVTYAIAGIVAASIGQSLQAMLQNPWTIGAFSLIFVLLALSLFGLYELQLPSFLRDRIDNLNRNRQGGSYLGVAIMGALSSLVVSPCVSAPLAGALVYLGSTGNIWLGGSALFLMGLGMGVPLIIVGTSGGKLFLKAGPWMEKVKTLLGVLLLAMAVWMLSRITSSQTTSLLWGSFLIISAIYMGALEPAIAGWQRLYKSAGVIMLVVGGGFILNIILIQHINTPQISMINNSANPTAPQSTKIKPELFHVVHTPEQFNKTLNQFQKSGKPILIDYYASWCVACKEMDHGTFKNQAVREELKHFNLMRIDVTENNTASKQLEKKYQIFAPPSIVFLSPDGKLIEQAKIAGAVSSDELLNYLHLVDSVYGHKTV